MNYSIDTYEYEEAPETQIASVRSKIGGAIQRLDYLENVYNASGTVYANVGVTYVSDTFENKGVVSYSARVLGQDKDAVVQGNAALIKITGADGVCYYKKKFWNTQPRVGTVKINRNKNSYVNVYVEIEGRSDSRQIRLN